MEPEEPKSLVFRFSDPRQQRIYEELKEVVGPGPAAFFHDACRLMANPETLHTTAHLVSVQERIRALKEAQVATEADLQHLEQAILDKAFQGRL